MCIHIYNKKANIESPKLHNYRNFRTTSDNENYEQTTCMGRPKASAYYYRTLELAAIIWTTSQLEPLLLRLSCATLAATTAPHL